METRELRKRGADAPSDPLVGALFDGRYAIVDAIGGGGVGTVYRANDAKLDRSVAIKVLHAELVTVEVLGKRFEQEARILASLRHPNIVTVMDYGVSEGRPYFVMELLEGRSLRERLAHGLPESEEAIAILKQVLRGLAYAHAKGIAHRDLKPDNVFLQSIGDGEIHVRLLDFGFAKLLADESDGGPPLTRAGQVFGTPAYMAPEQVAASPTDARSDVYAAGVLLYELVAGRRPFEGPAPEILRQHLIAEVPPIATLREDRSPTPELEAVLARALAKEPDQRFADASVMLAAIDDLAQPIFRTAVKEASAPWPVAPAAAPPKKIAPRHVVLAGAGAGVVLLAGILTCVAFAVSGDDTVVSRKASPSGAAVPEEPATERATPVDEYPWIEPIPPALARVKAQLDSGRAPRSDNELRSYARSHPRDGRPAALLGRIYLARGWRPDAMEQYEKALELTPGLATDEATLEDVLSLALHSATHRRGTTLLVRYWGVSARPYAEARRGTVARADHDRLEAVLASLPR
jgi:hypothetical protein